MLISVGRQLAAWTLVWLCALLLTMAPSVLDARGQESPAGRLSLSDFERLCATAGSPMFGDVRDANRLSLSAHRRRLNRILNESAPYGGSALNPLWAAVQERAGEGVALLDLIEAIEDHKPTNFDLIWKVLTTGDSDKEKDARNLELFKRVAAEGGEMGLRQKFRELNGQLNQAIVTLASLRGNYQASEIPNGVVIHLLPAWHGVYAGDSLELQNNTQTGLANAVILVTVKSADGQAVSHVHYADRWASGSSLRVYYWNDDDYVGRETVNEPRQVNVVVYSGGSAITAEYDLTPDEWDHLVADYCAKLRIQGTFLGDYVEDGSSQTYAPGFKFSFSGLRQLPVTAVQIEFSDGDGRQSVVWKGTELLEASEWHAYRSEIFRQGTPAFDRGSPPKHIVLTLAVADAATPLRFEIY